MCACSVKDTKSVNCGLNETFREYNGITFNHLEKNWPNHTFIDL